LKPNIASLESDRVRRAGLDSPPEARTERAFRQAAVEPRSMGKYGAPMEAKSGATRDRLW
jgi:hypothetical protein